MEDEVTKRTQDSEVRRHRWERRVLQGGVRRHNSVTMAVGFKKVTS